MNKTILWVVIVAVFLFVGYMAFTTPSQEHSPVAGQTVKIGFVSALSGDAGALGQQQQRVVAERISQINEEAGEEGAKFEVVYEDGKCTGAEAVKAFSKLTDVDGVKVIIGGLCSSETLAMAPLATDKHVVLISAASSNPKIEDQGDYVFSLSYSDKQTALNLAKAVSGFKKVAMVTEQNDFNIGIRDGVVEALKAYPSAVLVSNEVFPKGASDFRAMLQKVRATAPDALILNPNPGVTAENLLKQLAEIKTWEGYKLFGQYAYLGDTSRAAVGAFAEGMTIIDVPTVNNAEFMKLYGEIEAKGGSLGDLGNYYTATSLDAVDLVAELIKKYGNDSAKIQEALAHESFSGFIGPIKFDGNNFVEFNASGTYIVKDGKAVLQ